jgi:hypothetical protein
MRWLLLVPGLLSLVVLLRMLDPTNRLLARISGIWLLGWPLLLATVAAWILL